MKICHKLKHPLSLIIFIFLSNACTKPAAPPAVVHNEVGNGGDLSLEIRSRAWFILTHLEAASGSAAILNRSELGALRKAILETPIEITDIDLRDEFGIARTLITQHSPSIRILANRERFKADVAGSLEEVGLLNLLQIILHEFCHAGGLEDRQGQISHRLLLSERDYLLWRRSTLGYEADSVTGQASDFPHPDKSLTGTGLLWLGMGVSQVAVQPDGKLLVASSVPHFGVENINRASSLVLHRFHPWGGLDTDFGLKGRVELIKELPLLHAIQGIFFLPNDSFLVVTGAKSQTSEIQLRKFNADGSAANILGNAVAALPGMFQISTTLSLPNHTAIIAAQSVDRANHKKRAHLIWITKEEKVFSQRVGLGLEEDEISAMTVGADGKILLAGKADNESSLVARLELNGQRDVSFGDSGVVRLGKSELTALAVQKSGRILLAMNRPVSDGVAEGFISSLLPNGDPELVDFGNDGGTFRISKLFETRGMLNLPPPKFKVSQLSVDQNDNVIVAGMENLGAVSSPVAGIFPPSLILRLSPKGNKSEQYFSVSLPGGGPGIVLWQRLDEKNRLTSLVYTAFRGFALIRQTLP